VPPTTADCRNCAADAVECRSRRHGSWRRESPCGARFAEPVLRYAVVVSDSERIELAKKLLQEAVFASRGRSAPKDLDGSGAGCGLGAGPNLDLALTDDGERVASLFWPAGLEGARASRARALLTEWIRRQDALDRKRNHFLKAFRGEHGFDRAAYTSELAERFEAGLEAVNAESLARLDEAATELASV